MADLPKLDFAIKTEEVTPTEVLKLRVEVWKKTVDVQEHFNDIALRLRSVAISVLVGAVGAAFYVAKDAGHWASLGIVLMGVFGWSAFFLMDRYWYHVFLRAAGMHAGEIEKRIAKVLPEMALSTAISDASKAVEIPAWPKDHPFYKGGTYSSTQRLVLFYQLGFAVLTLAAVIAIVLAIVPYVPRAYQRLTQVDPPGVVLPSRPLSLPLPPLGLVPAPQPSVITSKTLTRP